ncbi:GGDEF domain-containing protein [Thiohalorhabdus sp.]|uniref:GGDEF domain-containing protein n=1 Tax=Thiohalorhabdus sp. TaxID=3094134 RepID=UPI002FC31CA5
MIGRKLKDKRSGGTTEPDEQPEEGWEARSRERQWSRIEATLEQALARLALFGFEQDPQLDSALSDLRAAIREGQEPARVAELAGQAEATIRNLGLPKASREQAAQPRALLLDVLNSIGFPRRLAGDVRDLRRRLRDPDQEGNLPYLAKDLAELVQAGQKESRQGGLKGMFGGDPGVPLRGLLNRLHVPEPHREPVADIQGRLEGTRDGQDLVELAEELAGRLNAALSGEGALISKGGSCAPELVRPVHRILDALGGTSDDLSTEADRLRNRLYANPAPSDLPTILAGAADLSGRAREHYERERQDLETFLQQMAENLGTLGQRFQAAQAEQADASEQTRRHSEDIQAQMDGLATDIQASEELEGLKDAVQGRLEVIQERVEAVQQTEAQREKDLERRVATLSARLEEMEQESQQLRQQLQQKWRLAHTDSLTELPNRLGYEEQAAPAVAHWRRHGQALALIVVDVDNFKAVNDHYGHQAGDKALQVIGGLLQNQLQRETDFIARYGGEEFVAMLPETGLDQAVNIAEGMRQTVDNARFTFRGERAEISISAGVAEFGSGETLESVFHRADQAVLTGKNQGRNRVIRAEAGANAPEASGPPS